MLFRTLSAAVYGINADLVLTAVKTGDVRSVTDTEITRPGPRLATGMRNLALAMYPDLVLPYLAP